MFSMVCFMAPISFIPSFFVWVTPNSPHVYGWLIYRSSANIGKFFMDKSSKYGKLNKSYALEFSKLFFATILGILFFDENWIM